MARLDIIGPNLIRFPPLKFLQHEKVRTMFRKQRGAIWAVFNETLLYVMDKVRAKVLFNASRYVLMMSAHSSDIMVYLGVRRDKIVVMPAAAIALAVDDDAGLGAILEKIEKRRIGRKVVLYAGALSEPKGAALLADLIKTTSEGAWLYVVVGRGALRALFQAISEKNDNVIFTGHLDRQDLIRLYGMVDIYVQPTYEEQLSVTVIESLRAGTPVLCSNHPSFFKLWFGKSVEFFELGNLEDLRSKLSHMVANIGQHKEDAEKNKEAYDVEVAARFLLELYQDIASVKGTNQLNKPRAIRGI